MLGLSTLSASAASVVIFGAPFLIPSIRETFALPLDRAALVSTCLAIGVLVSLVPWGWLVDRVGERRVLGIGLGATAAACAGMTTATAPGTLGLWLFLTGASASSVNTASGRVVMGWFPARRRGLAMGARQMAQPLGGAIAAVAVPVVAEVHGPHLALLGPGVASAAAALLCVTLVVDPPRPDAGDGSAQFLRGSPYRESKYLPRIHLASMASNVPQTVMGSFMLVWLVSGRGWGLAEAGALVAGAQILGAGGRMLGGAWSDALASRTRPLRVIAVFTFLAFAGLAVGASTDSPVAVGFLVVASVAAVADNGLAFTAVAEYAGPFWSGRSFGVQNSLQWAAASVTAPVAGALVESAGFAAAFALTASFPLLALAALPRHDRRRTHP